MTYISYFFRPHLDYGDVIYHVPAKRCEFSNNVIVLNLMVKLESVQYSFRFSSNRYMEGTSREKLYNELGGESLNSRRWSRRLTLFFKYLNGLSPKSIL